MYCDEEIVCSLFYSSKCDPTLKKRNLFQFREVAKERAPCLYSLTQNEGMSGKDLARTDKVSVRINIENF